MDHGMDQYVITPPPSSTPRQPLVNLRNWLASACSYFTGTSRYPRLKKGSEPVSVRLMPGAETVVHPAAGGWRPHKSRHLPAVPGHRRDGRCRPSRQHRPPCDRSDYPKPGRTAFPGHQGQRKRDPGPRRPVLTSTAWRNPSWRFRSTSPE